MTPEPEEVVEVIPEEIEAPETPSKEEVKWDPNTPKNIEEFRAAWIATVANITGLANAVFLLQHNSKKRWSSWL